MYIHGQKRLDVIIPTLDSELALFQKLEARLKEAGIALYIPSAESVKRRAKSDLVQFCKEANIATPDTIVIREPGQVNQAVEEIGFPMMIKGVFYEAYQCSNVQDVQTHFNKIREQWGLPVIAQKVIKGEEFDVCCLGGEKGELLGAVPIRKVGLTDKGKAWAAITLRNEALLEFSGKILRELRWSGPCEMEIMKEERTDKLFLLEINPRFPAWVYLCAGANQNLPRLVVDLALGKSVKALPPAVSGITFVRHATDLLCPLEYIESLTINGELHYRREE